MNNKHFAIAIFCLFFVLSSCSKTRVFRKLYNKNNHKSSSLESFRGVYGDDQQNKQIYVFFKNGTVFKHNVQIESLDSLPFIASSNKTNKFDWGYYQKKDSLIFTSFFEDFRHHKYGHDPISFYIENDSLLRTFGSLLICGRNDSKNLSLKDSTKPYMIYESPQFDLIHINEKIDSLNYWDRR